MLSSDQPEIPKAWKSTMAHSAQIEQENLAEEKSFLYEEVCWVAFWMLLEEFEALSQHSNGWKGAEVRHRRHALFLPGTTVPTLRIRCCISCLYTYHDSIIGHLNQLLQIRPPHTLRPIAIIPTYPTILSYVMSYYSLRLVWRGLTADLAKADFLLWKNAWRKLPSRFLPVITLHHRKRPLHYMVWYYHQSLISSFKRHYSESICCPFHDCAPEIMHFSKLA